ncbi:MULTISPECIES: type II toxin-antitoxin system antitoxin HipB [Pantoea]|jgi:HTH-type transcriptional regulator/antitoxin HipB|uniref:Type II toxin-antitoxin system antitoxin HipB n=2 Tax=Pantoea TaxID=53335 RepID=A0AAU7U1M6_9GAMM|nr:MULTISPECIES: type II toxin-antitoxin system antitoxin HipB [unclassified Pantoea]MBD9644667.1 type II toxin-antitoxin system antitoxin HipB [Pantoea sp. PNT02]MBD9659532.1 type II toxin-antitoxin system antitoxin HipB [Pantoea sp. PNT03]MBY4840264.1 type II toxin-antitoxin system antitoxin HipB [Pantoea sp. DY-5]MBY4952796.1 type II toxin-antitoxin system antitoxin HipB [Pantoea sp. DY-17]PYG49622.1 HTH-type transcriptional regulator/antitoxin HipB [Pantoea sp. AG1095]
MIYSPRQLAHHVRLIRQKNHWTQSELAKKVGLKQATISHFENNPDLTTLATLFKILQSLDLKMDVQEKDPSAVNGQENDW